MQIEFNPDGKEKDPQDKSQMKEDGKELRMAAKVRLYVMIMYVVTLLTASSH